MKIAFFGSSILSSYWNGAATYYRGIIRALAKAGHSITFYEPDAFDRQSHRDMEPPDWVKVVVYDNSKEAALKQVEESGHADWVIKASGVGVFDELLENSVLQMRRPSQLVSFWDVDAPATLDRLERNPADPFRNLIPQFDLLLTYGGGKPVVNAYQKYGARTCCPIYNGLDPATHYRVQPDERFVARLSFLGNRLPDRESRVDEFFFRPAAALPEDRFLLAGNGWRDRSMPENVGYLGHLYCADHNAFNCSSHAVLNINRDSMARYGYSPATRVFEAAGAGACIVSDDWAGIEEFFEPGEEILVAKDGAAILEILGSLTASRARSIGDAAYRRAIEEHTYSERAKKLETIIE